MKLIIKILLMTAFPIGLGYLLQINFNGFISKEVAEWLIYCSLLSIPFALEMTFKVFAKKSSQKNIQISKFSGYLFVLSLLLLFLSIGFSLAD